MNLKLAPCFPFYKNVKYTYYTKFTKILVCQNLVKLSEILQTYKKKNLVGFFAPQAISLDLCLELSLTVPDIEQLSYNFNFTL